MVNGGRPLSTVVEEQKQYFFRGKTRGLTTRLGHLRTLKKVIKAYESKIVQALHHDLNKSEYEAYLTEIGIVLEEIRFVCKRLKRWAKPKKVKTALTHTGSKGVVIPEPYGTVLIIAPWNYPFQLAISPLIGAIAAGNTAVLKPSELSPAVSALLVQIIEEVFPPQCVSVIEGGVEVSTELLKQKFDYIFFTGSSHVGKVVMEAAAKHLTPVTLELGGKSPCIVHRDADVKLAAKRIAFGKFTNAGQTCIAPDYLLVHREVKASLIKELQRVSVEFFGERPLEESNYGKIVSERHFDRLVRFLQDGAIVAGGRADRQTLKIEPTVLDGLTWDAPIMQDEIFGPLLPIIEYDNPAEFIEKIRERPKPLAFYLFAQDRELKQELIEKISFGGGCINDTLMHIATPYLPFGGVGESGMGSYHGEESFKTFSHYKSVLQQTSLFDFPFRYPSSKNGLRIIKRLLK